MRVLVAGASGAIGSYLVPLLIEAKHEVIGITRRPGTLADIGAREIVADVLDRPALLAALDGVKADAVIHQLTALSKAPRTAKDMRETNRLRAEGTSTLIAAARKVGAKKFVAASFFGGYGYNDLGPDPLPETAPFGEPDDRNDAVLLALLSLEQQVRAFGGVSLRYGLFYDSTTTAVTPVSRTWDGLLPMLHVKDAARAAVLALAKYKSGSVFNIADDHPMTYRDRELARAEAAHIKPPQQLPDSILRLAAPSGSMLLTRTNMKLDSSRARAELGWKPEFESLSSCLGVDAPSVRRVNIPVAEPAPVKPPIQVKPPLKVKAAAEPRVVAEPKVIDEKVEEAPLPEAEIQEKAAADGPGDDGPHPDPEFSPEPEPAEAPEPEREPESEPEPEPEPHSKSEVSDDPFRDIDAAIARIGARNPD